MLTGPDWFPAAATLFRSNTALTRLLETTMRLYAVEYVRLAVGPTIRDVCDRKIAFRTLQSGGAEFTREERDRDVVELCGLVSKLWRDIYDSRQLFPE